jgi:hypothetical protein
MGCPALRQRLATDGDARGVFKSRRVVAAVSHGPDQAGALFLMVNHGGSFGKTWPAAYGNESKDMA